MNPRLPPEVGQKHSILRERCNGPVRYMDTSEKSQLNMRQNSSRCEWVQEEMRSNGVSRYEVGPKRRKNSEWLLRERTDTELKDK